LCKWCGSAQTSATARIRAVLTGQRTCILTLGLI
jgi:hypothetical protein